MDNALDIEYDRYHRHSRSQPPLDGLMAAVRAEAKRITRDDDAAQETVVAVLDGLDSFDRKDDTSFSRWVRRIAKIRKRGIIPKAREKLTVSFDEVIHSDFSDSYVFLNFTQLPAEIRSIALALNRGDSFEEIADRRNVKIDSLQKKVRRYVRKRDLKSLNH